MQKVIPIFIGYDFRERAATNVLIDSLYQKSSMPISVTPIVLNQLINDKVYWRLRDPKQSTDFSFSRFLVPFLMNFKGWAIFMDCDMLCRGDISELWSLKDESKAIMCAKHIHEPIEKLKFLGEPQSKYKMKNWSSLILFNCSKCKALSLDYVNNASGLQLHQFHWLESEEDIGEIDKNNWNYLIDVNNKSNNKTLPNEPKLIHWTLGGPWFKDSIPSEKNFSDEWFEARKKCIEI